MMLPVQQRSFTAAVFLYCRFKWVIIEFRNFGSTMDLISIFHSGFIVSSQWSCKLQDVRRITFRQEQAWH